MQLPVRGHDWVRQDDVSRSRGVDLPKPILLFTTQNCPDRRYDVKLEHHSQLTTNRNGGVVAPLVPADRHRLSYNKFQKSASSAQSCQERAIARVIPVVSRRRIRPLRAIALTILTLFASQPTTRLRRFSRASADASSSLTQSQSCCPQRLRCRLLARTPLKVCQSAGNLLLVESATWKRSSLAALAPSVRSFVDGHAGVGNMISLLVLLVEWQSATLV